MSDTNASGMTDEALADIGRKTLAKQAKQKSYDKWYMDKARHELTELRTFAKDNDFVVPTFDKTPEDYLE